MGCGAVDDGVCPGEQSDDIECTVDVCSAEAGAWAHIPNNSLCEAGQACSPTAGCVAAGALTGTATLLGETDHSGITVTVDGIEGATTTTDAAGAWTIAIPPGTYTVSYSKETYVPEASNDIIVLAEAAERAPDVELWHGETLGDDRTIVSNYGTQFNANRTYIIEGIPSAFGSAYYATPTDASSGPVYLISNPSDIRYTATHAVFTTSNNGGIVVWSRPLNGSTPAKQLFVSPAGYSLNIQGTPGAYVAWTRSRFNGEFSESQLWVTKSDGSAPPSAPVYTGDATHIVNFLTYNDTTGVMGTTNLSNPAGLPNDGVSTLHRLDLATGTLTSIDIGPTNSVQVSSISPDQNFIYGQARQFNGSSEVYRGFWMQVSGTSVPTLSFDVPGTSFTRYADNLSGTVGWTPTGSLVFTTTFWFNGSGLSGNELKVWAPGATQAALIGSQSNFNNQFLVGEVVVYRELSTRFIRAATAHSPTVTQYVLDNSGNNTSLPGSWRTTIPVTNPTSGYVVWQQFSTPSNSIPFKVMAATFPSPMTVAPTVVQLGSNLATSCALTGELSGTTFYSLCAGTGTLQAYSQGSSVASGSTTNVIGGLVALRQNNRIAYRKTDGNVYTATGSFGADEKLLADKIDPQANILVPNTGTGVFSPWVIFRDSESETTRASRVDASAIDEAIFGCDATFNSSLWINDAASHLFAASARCATNDFRLLHAPATNMP